ncbi:DNA invertase [Minicystis rosea]|nr:DNA invertase [Minicystis rosea]
MPRPRAMWSMPSTVTSITAGRGTRCCGPASMRCAMLWRWAPSTRSSSTIPIAWRGASSISRSCWRRSRASRWRSSSFTAARRARPRSRWRWGCAVSLPSTSAPRSSTARAVDGCIGHAAGAPPSWSNPPYGLRVIRGERHLPGTIVIEECEAAVVRQVLTWVGMEGLRLRQVARRLDERGIKPRSGERWSPSTLGKMVRNRVYVGQAHHQKYQSIEPKEPRDRLRYRRHRKSSSRRRPEADWLGARVPAIVDEALFEKAQERLFEHRRQTAGQVKHPYLLRGLLWCCTCARKMWGFGCDVGTRHERRYYACNGRDHHAAHGDRQCPSRPVRAEDVEQVVWADLSHWLQEPEQLAIQLGAQRDKIRTVLEAHAAEQRRLVRQARSLTHAIERLVDAYQAEAITLEELRGRREHLEEAKQRCHRELTELEHRHDQALTQRRVVDEIQQLRERLHQGLERCTWDDRRAIVGLLIEKIEVDEPNLRVHYVVPLGTSGGCSAPVSSEQTATPACDGAGRVDGSLCQPCPRDGGRER